MRSYARPLAGLAMVVAIVGIVIVAAGMFRGSFADTVPLTVLSQRAGLVMNPDAKVKLVGVPVGNVVSIQERPNGQAAILLAMDPAQLAQIPDNVKVDISSSTVFGAKSIDLVAPANPSTQKLRPGQVLTAEHVTVEFNTIFQQLSSVLSAIQPEKLNETLGAISSAFNGRGPQLGRTLSDFDALLAKLEPSLPNLAHDSDTAPEVLNAYADASRDLVTTLDDATHISQTITEEQNSLDAFLVSTIGLADVGNDVLGSNRAGISDVFRVLVPTTDLTNRYHQGLNCGISALAVIASGPPLEKPGITDSIGFLLGRERYRYPMNLPKVAATGGPQCTSLPRVPFDTGPPFVVTDVGTNQAQYGNQGILLNSDGLKQLLFGPLPGPARNTAQIGEPG
ncbi:MCE family protein [Mycolicibacterium aichiense]|uniref:MCE family protein n=1 Tax=Mycolicibacterium aichiense TaxID=1799 RepID=UPI000DF9066D|nr:MCE family protein [Mycolicibacterium aichiense]MCV7019828.1 MCE family protein [Mycolicibacterium aichiense]STZ80612.1 virulence factor Mce [Mycolicibacterium aichiense]